MNTKITSDLIALEGFCKTPYTREALSKGFNVWDGAIPEFDEENLLNSITLLRDHIKSPDELVHAIKRITDTFIWPLTAIALVTENQNKKYQITTIDKLLYPIELPDFKLEDSKSLASHVLKKQMDIFIADTGIHSQINSVFKMIGEAVQDAQGDFPEYVDFSEEEDSLDHSLVNKDKNIFHQGLLLSFQSRKTRGLLLIGFQEQAFGNGGYPRTKFDRAWYYKFIKKEIIELFNKWSS